MSTYRSRNFNNSNKMAWGHSSFTKATKARSSVSKRGEDSLSPILILGFFPHWSPCGPLYGKFKTTGQLLPWLHMYTKMHGATNSTSFARVWKNILEMPRYCTWKEWRLLHLMFGILWSMWKWSRKRRLAQAFEHSNKRLEYVWLSMSFLNIHHNLKWWP